MLENGGLKPQMPPERDVPRPIRAIAAPLVVLAAIGAAAWCLPGRAPGRAAAEHLSAASALAGGQMLYRDLYCDQAPGLYILYRLIVLAFGASGSALWFADALAVTLSSLAVYLITRRFCRSTLAAMLAGIAYPLLYYGASRGVPAQPAGWAALLFLWALYLLAAHGFVADWARALVGGFLAAAAVLISPAAIIPCLLLLAIARRMAGAALAWFVLGAALYLLPVVAWLGAANAFGDMREQLLVWGPGAWRHRFNVAVGESRAATVDALLLRWLWERLAFTLPGVIPFAAGLGAFAWRRHGEPGRFLAFWLLLSLIELALRPGLPDSAWAPALAIWSITGAAGLQWMLRQRSWFFLRVVARTLIICGLALSVSHIRNAARPVAADRTVSGALTTLAGRVRAMTPDGAPVLVWDRAPHLYYLIGCPVAGGVVSQGYFSSAFAVSDDYKFFRSRFEKRPAVVILVRRRCAGEGAGRTDGLWPVIPPRPGLIEDEIAAHYALSGKVSGYEIFVRSANRQPR